MEYSGSSDSIPGACALYPIRRRGMTRTTYGSSMRFGEKGKGMW